MGWLIALAVAVALALFPLGFRAIYRKSDSGVWLLVGPFHFQVYPERKVKRKGKINKCTSTTSKGGSYEEFWVIFRAIIKFLGEFRKKICVKNLELKLILAVTYCSLGLRGT